VRPLVTFPAPFPGSGEPVSLAASEETGRPVAGVGTLPVETLPAEVAIEGAAPL
jgi:hypothetical protein